MLNELIKLANHLDGIGEFEISNKIDIIITKISQDTQFYGMGPSARVHPIVLEKQEEMIIERAKDAIEKIRDGYYGSIVMKYALTPSVNTQTKLNKYMTKSGEVNSVSDAERFLADFKSSIPVFQELYDQAGLFDSYYPRRVNGLVLDLERNIRDHKDIVSQVAEQSAPQVGSVDVDETETPDVARQSDLVESRKNPNILMIEEIIGALPTGQYPFNKGTYFALKQFLERNADKLFHPEYDPDDYVQKILDTGPKGFTVRGGEHGEITGRSFRDWRNLVEDLQMSSRRGVAQNAQLVTASHDGDYMSEFHAKSIENSAEEIVKDLEEGRELDPWQKSYLAQADQMTDSVEERLDQEEKIAAMTKALDKLFKY